MQDRPHPDLAVLILCPVARSEAGAAALMRRVPGAERVPDMAAALTRLGALPQARLLLICPRPELWVSLALDRGMPPSQAVAEWRRLLAEMMAALRQHRRRTTVLFDDFADDPAAVLTMVPGLADRSDATDELPPPPPADPVLAVIARDGLRRDGAAHALASELEAMALVPDEAVPEFDPDPDLVFQAYHGGVQDRITALSAAQAQIGALTAGLAGRAQEIETLTQGSAARESALSAAMAEAVQTAERASAETALLRDHIRLEAAAQQDLRAQLVAQTARTAEAEAAQGRADRQRKEVEERLAGAQQEAEGTIRQLRAQLHQMGQGLESCHVQLDALQAERQDLLAQIRELHEIGKEMEGYFERAQQLSGQVGTLTADAVRLQAELQAGQALLAERTEQSAWLEAEIQRIHRSRSYRMMAPLRRIRLAFRRAG